MHGNTLHLSTPYLFNKPSEVQRSVVNKVYSIPRSSTSHSAHVL
jgi:hypothetical protein